MRFGVVRAVPRCPEEFLVAAGNDGNGAVVSAIAFARLATCPRVWEDTKMQNAALCSDGHLPLLANPSSRANSRTLSKTNAGDRFIPTRACHGLPSLATARLVETEHNQANQRREQFVSAASPRHLAFSATLAQAMGLLKPQQMLAYDPRLARERSSERTQIIAADKWHRWCERQQLPAEPQHSLSASEISLDTRRSLLAWNSAQTFAIALGDTVWLGSCTDHGILSRPSAQVLSFPGPAVRTIPDPGACRFSTKPGRPTLQACAGSPTRCLALEQSPVH